MHMRVSEHQVESVELLEDMASSVLLIIPQITQVNITDLLKLSGSRRGIRVATDDRLVSACIKMYANNKGPNECPEG